MKRLFLIVAASTVAAGAALASSDMPMMDTIGDPAAGEAAFKTCKACHAIVDPEGTVIFKGGKVGPNLWGVAGRVAGAYEGSRFSKSLVAAGEAGLIWDEQTLIAWLLGPTDFLREYLDDPAAKSKMTPKMRKGAEDMAAYLISVSPDMMMKMDMDGEAEEGESN